MCDEAYEVGYKEGQMDMRRKMSGNSEFSQAQIAQLQAKNDQLGNIIDDRNLRIRKLQTQVAQLVEALEKIAVEIKRYQSFPLIVNPYDTTTIIKMILVEALEAAKEVSDET